MRPSAEALVAALIEGGLHIACAESLTGGMVTAGLVDVPGASRTLRGGVVAYDTAIKHSVVGVDADLLRERGAVDPDVARQLADRVRRALAVDGVPADVGLATTGVAGPDPQDSRPVGTVFIGIAVGDRVEAIELHFDGGRERIRCATVDAAIEHALRVVSTTTAGRGGGERSDAVEPDREEKP